MIRRLIWTVVFAALVLVASYTLAGTVIQSDKNAATLDDILRAREAGRAENCRIQHRQQREDRYEIYEGERNLDSPLVVAILGDLRPFQKEIHAQNVKRWYKNANETLPRYCPQRRAVEYVPQDFPLPKGSTVPPRPPRRSR